MLKTIVLALESGFEVALIIGILLVALEKLKKSYNNKSLFLGVGLAFILGGFAAYNMELLGGREFFEWVVVTVSFVFVLSFLIMLWTKTIKSKRANLEVPKTKFSFDDKSVVFLASFMLTVIPAVEIALFPKTIFIMTYSVVNTDLIIKFSGGLIGLVLSIIFALTLFKVTKKLSFYAFTTCVTLISFLFLVKQSVTIVQILLANALIQVSPAIFKILLFLINNLDNFMYGLIGVVGLLYILSTLAVKKIHKHPTGVMNPAQLRKVKAAARKDIRWLISAMSVLIVISSLTTVQAAFANKLVHLSPVTSVSATDGVVVIPMEHVHDHNLHRFGYTASDGTEIRFLIIRKSETAYGIGLDACRICGVAGYYQRKDQVICSKCDVVMNIPTIGFPGGCNPVPVPFNMENGNIVLEAQDFENEKKRFAETDIFNQ